MINNMSNNINLKTEYKKLKLFTILMLLEAAMPTVFVIEPGINICWRALASIIYIPPIISIISYRYNKNLIRYRISKDNDWKYKNAIRYRLTHFIIPAMIYFIISPLIFIITKNILYFTIFEVFGFVIFILYSIIISKKINQ